MASKKVVIGIAVVLAVVLVALVLAAVVAVAVVFSVRDDDDDFNGQPGSLYTLDNIKCMQAATGFAQSLQGCTLKKNFWP